jgi:hypothetical protein
VTTHRIEVDRQIVEFEGDRIAWYSTARPGKDRWVAMEIWKLAGGGWLVYTDGRSNIYHRGDTSCRVRDSGMPSGTEIRAADLPDDAVPCPECDPDWPEDMPSDAPVRFEQPRRKMQRCASYREVIQALSSARHSGTDRSSLSGPSRELLAMAEAADPELAGQPKPVMRIN